MRDPTAYVKKARLATAAGIDHDFNFLTGIERGLDGSKLPQHERARGFGRDMRKRMEEGRVIVERAPTGLSRSKMNRTGWDGK